MRKISIDIESEYEYKPPPKPPKDLVEMQRKLREEELNPKGKLFKRIMISNNESLFFEPIVSHWKDNSLFKQSTG